MPTAFAHRGISQLPCVSRAGPQILKYKNSVTHHRVFGVYCWTKTGVNVNELMVNVKVNVNAVNG